MTKDVNRGRHCILKSFFAASVCTVVLFVISTTDNTLLLNHVFHLKKSNSTLKDRKVIPFHLKAVNVKADNAWQHYLDGGPIPHNITYLIENANFCEKVGKETTLIAVASAPSNFIFRQLIRKSWGSQEWWSNKEKIKVLFLLGNPNNKTIQNAIMKEHANNGDVIQQDFVDSYRNLTFKSVMFLEWVSRHCLHTGYVLKVDDDVIIDVFQLISFLSRSMKPEEKSLICRIHGGSVVFRTGKWAVSLAQLPETYYPMYCHGPADVYSRVLIEELYEATWKVPFIPVEDAYLSGLLVRNIGGINFKTEDSFHTTMGYANEILMGYTEGHIPVISLPLRDVYHDAWAQIFCTNAAMQVNQLNKTYLSLLTNLTKCIQTMAKF